MGDADIIVGHNIDFDVKVVGCEMFRYNINNELSSKRRICTMKSTTDLCKISGSYGYKYPKLQELYKKLFNKILKIHIIQLLMLKQHWNAILNCSVEVY